MLFALLNKNAQLLIIFIAFRFITFNVICNVPFSAYDVCRNHVINGRAYIYDKFYRYPQAFASFKTMLAINDFIALIRNYWNSLSKLSDLRLDTFYVAFC